MLAHPARTSFRPSSRTKRAWQPEQEPLAEVTPLQRGAFCERVDLAEDRSGDHGNTCSECFIRRPTNPSDSLKVR